MPLTRSLESPLISEDEVLRRAALLQLVNMPSLEGVKQLVEAMVYFLEQKPTVGEEFVNHLSRPPLSALAEEPVLHLLDEDDEAVREQAAFILYRMGIRTSSKARMLKALEEDDSPWVRAYAAKALALLPGAEAEKALAEAIDNEAMLESIARMGEALALTGEAAGAMVLRDQAEQLREREPPQGEKNPELWARAAGDIALFLDALAAKLDGDAGEGKLTVANDHAWLYAHPDLGAIRVAGGPERRGFAAEVKRGDAPAAPLVTDSREALDDLRAVAWS